MYPPCVLAMSQTDIQWSWQPTHPTPTYEVCKPVACVQHSPRPNVCTHTCIHSWHTDSCLRATA